MSFKWPAALSKRNKLLRRQTLTNFSQPSQPRRSHFEKKCFFWHNVLLSFCYENLKMISIEAHGASIGSFYNRLKTFSNATKKAFTCRYDSSYSILLYLLVSLLYLPILLHVVFTSFVLVTFDAVHVNSARFKHINFSYHIFIELQKAQS